MFGISASLLQVGKNALATLLKSRWLCWSALSKPAVSRAIWCWIRSAVAVRQRTLRPRWGGSTWVSTLARSPSGLWSNGYPLGGMSLSRLSICWIGTIGSGRTSSRRALQSRDDAEDGTPGWAWAEDKVAGLLNAVPNSKKTGDGGVDARYYGAAEEVIPIQVKVRSSSPIGRPDLDKLLGAQTAMNNRGIHAPMSLMVGLYPPPRNLRTFAEEQGRVTLGDQDYPGDAGVEHSGNVDKRG